VTEPVTGAEAFPYPDDEPGRVRNLATQLQDAGLAVGGAMKRAHGGKGAIADRWVSEAGGRATAEIEAMVGLAGEATAGLGNAWMPLYGYAAALESARGRIDTLRAQYDQAEADYADTVAAASAGGAGRGALHDDALHTRSSRRAALHSQYENEMVAVRRAAILAGQQLGELARMISPAPHVGSPALVRASVLERLPFMAGDRGVRVLRTGGLVLVDTGNGHDDVRISQDPGTGQVTIVINGVAHRFSAAEAGKIVVRTQGGSDVIEVAPGVGLGFSVLGGDGKDLVAGGDGNDIALGGDDDDRVVGGRGDDALDGGDGNDHVTDGLSAAEALVLPVAFGGPMVRPRAAGGNDVVAGSDGNDRLAGEAGNDTIDGGDGADAIEAGAGDDVVYGSSGNDRVRGGEGNDRIDGGADSDHIDGQHGNDVIHGDTGDDEIYAGEGDDTVDGDDGRDYIDGQRGNDRIDGGRDIDVIYAGEGDDTVEGGGGHDYIDGYRGHDDLDGGSESDVVSGGAGDDTLTGDLGDDVIYAGAGRDAVTDQDGRNRAYVEGHDTVATTPQSVTVTVEIAQVPANIRIEGSPEFQDRVRADLETLASSPTGQQTLQRIREQGDGFAWTDGDQLTIRETDERGGAHVVLGDDSGILYNPNVRLSPSEWVAPISALQHELAHAYNHTSETVIGDENGRPHWYLGPDGRQTPLGVDADRDGRVTFDEIDRDDDGDIDHGDLDLNHDGVVNMDDGWTPNFERQAVGLPVDHDSNPETPDVPAHEVVDHPDELTENGLRKEMGLVPRTRY
jgi:hypothetical protein